MFLFCADLIFSLTKKFSLMCGLSFAFCVGLCAQSAANVPASLPPQQQAKAAAVVGAQQMTNIPYFSQKKGMTSTLTLNNNMPAQTKVMITVYSKNGKALTVPPVVLKPSSITNYPLQALTANAGGDFDSGNISIMYDGPSMGVTCQVGIFDPKSRVSFESRDAGMMDFMSSKLNGIISLPDAQTNAFVALTNIATHPVTVQWSIGAKHDELSLSSRETRVVKLTQAVLQSMPNSKGTPQVVPVLLQMQHDGEVGTIVATGFVLNLDRGYSSDFWLVDPATTPSNHLAGAHVRFGLADVTEGFPVGTSFRAPLALANVSSVGVTATISADYTIDGRSQNLKLARVSLEPGEVRQFELSEEMAQLGVSGPVEDAGVDIEYDGAPGSVIATLTSVDQSGDFAFEVPVKDPAGMDHMPINSYPWTLENGTKTVVHLKNTTAQDQWAVVQFRFPNGSTYNPDRIHLQPYETVPIDIQQLKDSKQKDVRKQIFPENATSGQVVWFEEVPKTIIGRAEHLNLTTGTSRSFSCGAPCDCPPSFFDSAMDPGPLAATIGTAGTFFRPEYTTEDCNGIEYGPFAAASSSWFSSNTGVATVQSTGEVSCVAPGSANISATIHERLYIDEGTLCRSTTATSTPSASLAVYDPTPNITAISPASWNAGTSTSIQVTGTGFGTNPTLTITDPNHAIAVGAPSLVSNTEIDTTVTIAASTPAENATVTVTSNGYNGQGFTSNQGNGPNSPSVNVPINPIAAPTPQITFFGAGVTGALQVFVGQQIALSASVNVPGGLAITSQSWSVPGIVIAGFTGSAASGEQVTQLLNFGNPSITFYWLTAGGSGQVQYQVTYSYCLANSQCNSGAATLNLGGPAATTAGATTTGVNLFNNVAQGDTIGFATNDGRPGIQFLANSTLPSGNQGSYQWVQLIKSQQSRLIKQSGPASCTIFTGPPGVPELDTTYPYGGNGTVTTTLVPNDTAQDSPRTFLQTVDGEWADSFSAVTYLRWIPNTDSRCTGNACTIPVPLGSSSWGYSDDAINTQMLQANHTNWTQACGQNSQGSAIAFVPSSLSPASNFGYLGWQNTVSILCVGK